MRWIAVICLAICLSSDGLGQTCCTGGVQYLGAYKVPTLNSKEFSFNLSFSNNKNSDLVLSDEIISENTNKRIANTMLLQVDYGFNDKFSLSVVIPYLWQTEEVNFQSVVYQIKNNGLGDFSVWSSYKQKFKLHTVIASAAIKAPSGKTDAVDPENGIYYPISFQQGTGSWDFMVNLYDESPLDRRHVFNWINMISAKVNTPGNKFEAHPEYRFGHTFQVSSSMNIRWVMGKFLSDAFAGVSYQYRLKDQFNGGFENENTGGHWVNVNLGYNHQFTPQWHAGIGGTMPIYRSVNGLQLTTDRQVNLTIGYTL
jgi:hypothetical protein